jgi:hypothetical protein
VRLRIMKRPRSMPETRFSSPKRQSSIKLDISEAPGVYFVIFFVASPDPQLAIGRDKAQQRARNLHLDFPVQLSSPPMSRTPSGHQDRAAWPRQRKRAHRSESIRYSQYLGVLSRQGEDALRGLFEQFFPGPLRRFDESDAVADDTGPQWEAVSDQRPSSGAKNLPDRGHR